MAYIVAGMSQRWLTFVYNWPEQAYIVADHLTSDYYLLIRLLVRWCGKNGSLPTFKLVNLTVQKHWLTLDAVSVT